jgi:hypothetical protein
MEWIQDIGVMTLFFVGLWLLSIFARRLWIWFLNFQKPLS